MEVTNAIIRRGLLFKREMYRFRKCIEHAKDAVANIAKELDMARSAFDATIHAELLGGSFFVLELSAYARLVCEFT